MAIRGRAAMLTRYLDYQKGCVCMWRCLCEGRRWKDPKMSTMCVCVCLYSLQLQRSTAVWKLLANVSSQPPFSVFCHLFLPFYIFLCKCVWNVCCVQKRLGQKSFQSTCLKGINSSVSLLNCFKELTRTDAIIHQSWRKHLCYWVIVWEPVWV